MLPLKKKNLINLLILNCILSINLFFFTSPASAIVQNFSWNGNDGYSAKIAFSYKEKNTPKIISEKGKGKTNYLDSLVVSFYNSSSDKPIRTYSNIVNGNSFFRYFEFNFDTKTQQVLGNLDIGGEKIGDIFLQGIVNKELSLIKIKQYNNEPVIDRSLEKFFKKDT